MYYLSKIRRLHHKPYPATPITALFLSVQESPEIWEVLVPYELLFEVSDHLKNGAWLDQLEAEYLSGGSHNMTVAMDTLQELIRVAEQNEVRIERLRYGDGSEVPYVSLFASTQQ